MDLYTLYDWITSLLRPRGRCKAVNDPQHQSQPKESTTTATTNGSSASTAAAEAASNKFELIPTLHFVIQSPVEASLDLQYVSATCVATSIHEDRASPNASAHDDDDDSDSRHTYVITTETSRTPTTPTTDNEAETQPATRTETRAAAAAATTTDSDGTLQRQEVIWSLCNAANDDEDGHTPPSSLSSFVDEPTSSISIEMDNLSKTTRTETSTARTGTGTGTGTAEGSALAPTTTTTTSRRNSNQSAMTAATTPSSDQSIEEEIEEALETSDEQIDGDGDGNSLQLSEAAGLSLPATAAVATSADKQPGRHFELFGIDVQSLSTDSEDERGAGGTTSSDDGQFRIDDDQLSGGKLAQHFVLDDDDDDDDEEDNEPLNSKAKEEEGNDADLIASLPPQERVVHSRHDDAASDVRVALGEQPESLSNQSTADDVSDFIDEPRAGGDPLQSEDENLELSPPPMAGNQSALSVELNAIGAIAAGSPNDDYAHMMLPTMAASTALSGASSEHSEKDHSLEELVAANHSIDMTLDARDLSSLNASFDIHNETFVNRLLADTMEGASEAVGKSLENTSLDYKEKDDNSNIVKSHVDRFESPTSSKIVTDLDESSAHDTHKAQSDPKSQINSQSIETEELTVDIPVKNADSIKMKSETMELLPRTPLQPLRIHALEPEAHEEATNQAEDDEDTSLELMKVRILAMKLQSKEHTSPSGEPTAEPAIVKQMERVPLTEFNKDVLEDITEESERNSLSTAEEQQSISMEKSGSTAKSENKTLHNDNPETSASMVSLNMIRMLEQKVDDLQNVLTSKDACLASLNLQLENSQRRGSNGALSSEQPCSGRDTSSLLTNSTEYRTFQEDFGGGATMDFYMELCKRDELIAKLTDSLQQSVAVRENLQAESEKLTTEVQLVRKQLTEAMEAMRPAYWPRDQESNGGQRISEISMDLISESDDDLERHFFTDNEEKYSRNSRERQLSVPRQMEASAEGEAVAGSDWSQTPFSKQIEQFQKYLTPSEVRLFFMVQKKFDDFLSQELEKCKFKCEHELKQTVEQLEHQKIARDIEIKRLVGLRQETDSVHTKEMEDLRKYFETKCADLEKQYSDDVFSQKSQRIGADSSSECSDQDQMPEELASPAVLHARSKETSPRKRTRAELLLSPSHRQMTPFGEDNNKDGNGNVSTEIAEMKSFYQGKIHDMQRTHEDHLRKLNEKVKYYESRYPDDDFMQSTKRNEITNATTIPTDNTIPTTNVTNSTDGTVDGGASVAQQVADANTSLIIIDQDELNPSNESQVIQKIIEEYERRLQEQLTLAREDIVHELEHQIQTLLSETTADDHHWPPELILLREKFTAKSQLEIAQLQLKHEEEMSRLKLEHEKQLNRKTKRNLSFDSARDFDRLVSERDSLRELSQTFRHVLAELAKCVASCENEINYTILEEVQRVLAHNRTVDEQHQLQEDDLPFNLSATSMFNVSLNASRQQTAAACGVPDVHALLEVVEDPSLLQYVVNSASADEFDLQQCVERLRAEAAYLLQLSEGLGRRQKYQSSGGGSAETRNESAIDQVAVADGVVGAKGAGGERQFLRTKSLNEEQLPTYQQRPLSSAAAAQPAKLLCSLPPDLNSLYETLGDELLSMSGGNASELNLQVHELRNRLLKSESDRVKLQQELEHTITRNTVLGQELQTLRDHLSAQLNSLSQTDVAEGYGLGSLKSPERLGAACDESSSGFAQLQEKARNLLSLPTQQQHPQPKQQLQQTSGEGNHDATVVLLQMIEDFCREGDKVVETSKKDREDLQSQIDAADKQLKATRQFLEEQATEREQERDEFVREIERLKAQLRDKEKERSSYEHASKEVEQLETQIRELTQCLNETSAKRDKFEIELKASIDKIFVLREIISELETQVETKALNEHVLGEKNKQLEEYINSQSRSNETLQNEVHSLKIEIGEGYQERIRILEEKLQNIRPSAEQSMVLDHVVEQLRDIESTLDHKTRALESLHHSASSNSCSEDVSVHGTRPLNSLPASGLAIVSPPQGSPVHPSPRQHSFTMEGVQRVVDKLSKHTRVEEAAIKRVRDLEMQVTQMRNSCVELQHERDSLQERMSEQTQRISALQSRIEEQRHRAEELQRAGTSDLSIRIHDLQTEVQNQRETLSARDKQIATMKTQLEKSRTAMERLEAELAVEQQPDRSVVSRLEADLKQRTYELQKVRERMKSEMINKLSLPDLMETMLADKNEEIDHLKEQLEGKDKALQSAIELNLSQNSSRGGGGDGAAVAAAAGGTRDETSNKLSARTLSDIVSISEFAEPDVVRRAAQNNANSPLVVPDGSGGFLHQSTMETSKEAVANLTDKRLEDLSVFAQLRQVNTFEHPHYFQDPNVLLASGKSGATITPVLVPRQINFSALTDESKPKSWPLHHEDSQSKETIKRLQNDLAEVRGKLEASVREKETGLTAKEQAIRAVEADLAATQQRLGGLQQELELRQQEIVELRAQNEANERLQQDIGEKAAEIEQLLSAKEQLTHERQAQSEQLSKHEKNLLNYRENEEKYLRRIAELERELLLSTEQETAQRETLRKELQSLGAAHEQCKYVQRDAELRKQEIERLNEELKAKDERLQLLTARLVQTEERTEALQRQIDGQERDLERLRQQQQQQNSEHSSKQFSVDEIAKQVEKELNYSAQLDSNILRAIESEEENNLDVKQSGRGKSGKEQEQQVATAAAGTEPQGTDDENFTGERDLLNQLELLRAQIAVEREQSAETREELLAEKQHSQEIQEQDVLIIEAMRKRLETALEKEDELLKQLDMERERCERLQTQLTALQRAESRRNSSLLLKSPTESPRKSPRSLADFESELAERLRSELKLLAAQNERERERCADLQRSGDRERQRHETELQERIAYCDRLKREMEKVARDKDTLAEDNEHLQERLTLQTQEIESLEARLAALQEAETRRSTRRDRHHKESAQMLAELHDLKTKLMANEGERDALAKTIAALRYDVERSAQREAQLAEALANANSSLANASDSEATVPQQFLQKMKEINTLLAENTRENRQMAETVQFLVEERRQLQKRCEDLDAQLSSTANVGELEERCNHLLGRYLRVESHRKALVYQKRYLKISLQSYQDSEQRALAALNGGHMLQPPQQRTAKRKLFKTVALAIIAIQRMKYIGRIWHTGKRIVSKSVFTITQQKRSQAPAICCGPVSSISPTSPPAASATQMHQLNSSPFKLNDRQFAPLQAPSLLNEYASSPTPLTPLTPSFDWPRLRAQQQ